MPVIAELTVGEETKGINQADQVQYQGVNEERYIGRTASFLETESGLFQDIHSVGPGGEIYLAGGVLPLGTHVTALCSHEPAHFPGRELEGNITRL